MFHKLVFARPIGDQVIFASFQGGELRLYNILPLMERWPAFEQLEDEEFFRSFKVDKGGYGISWNDDLDLSADELYEGGIVLPLEFTQGQEITRAFARARRESHLSQSQLEEASGVRQPVIARFENGTSSPRLDTILKALAPMGKTLAIVDLEPLEMNDCRPEPASSSAA